MTFTEWVLQSLETFDICKQLVDGDPYMTPNLSESLKAWGSQKAVFQSVHPYAI